MPSRAATSRYAVTAEGESSRSGGRSPNSHSNNHSSHHKARTPGTKSSHDSPYLQPTANGSTRSSKRGSLKSPRMVDVAPSPRIGGPTSKSPDLSRSGRTPTPDRLFQGQEESRNRIRAAADIGISQNPKSSSHRYRDSPELSRRSPEAHSQKGQSRDLKPTGLRSPVPPRSAPSPDPHRYMGSSGHDYRALRSPEPIPEESSSAAVTPVYSRENLSVNDGGKPPSRRRSLTERTRSLLGKKPSSRGSSIATNEDGVQRGTSTEIPRSPRQPDAKSSKLDPQAAESTKEGREQPRTDRIAESEIKSKSSSREHLPYKQGEIGISGLRKEANKRQADIASQDLAPKLSLLPAPQFSPLEAAFPSDVTKPRTPKVPADQSPKPEAAVTHSLKEDKIAETKAKSGHPLLQEDRHARFNKALASRNLMAPPSQDLPLRHYHSSADLGQRSSSAGLHNTETDQTPRRSSSFLESGRRSDSTSTSNKFQQAREDLPGSGRATPTTSAVRSQSALGIHPAHRQEDRPATASRTSSPVPSTISSTISTPSESGATPPPISTGPGHLITSPKRSANSPGPRARSPPRHPYVTSDSSTSTSTKPQGGDPKQMPFYLNPASSSALIEFLEASPPPSPGPASRAEPSNPPPAPQSQFSYERRNEREDMTASPPPPGPSRGRFGLFSASTSDLRNGHATAVEIKPASAKKVFGLKKKIFGGERQGREREPSKDASRKGSRNLFLWNKENPLNEAESPSESSPGGNGQTGVREKEGGFMGVGKDGVWISRKNFQRH